MNEISVKLESPKEIGVIASPLPESGENAVDPLAIESEEKVKQYDVEAGTENTEQRAGNCDDNAKEKNEDWEKDVIATELEKITAEEDLLKEDTISLNNAAEDPFESNEAPTTMENTNNDILDTNIMSTEPSHDLSPTPDISEGSPSTLEPLESFETEPEIKNPPPDPVKTPSPVLKVPSPVEAPSPIEQLSPLDQPNPVEESSPEEHTRPVNPILEENPSAEENLSLIEHPKPVEQPRPLEQPSLTNPSVLENLIEPEQTIKKETIDTPLQREKLVVEGAKLEELSDVEMTSIHMKKTEMVKEKIDMVFEKLKQKEIKPNTAVNGDVSKEDQPTKRRASIDTDADYSPLKRLCLEVEKTFPQHDTMINDYIQTATKNNIEEIQRHTEQLLAEIQTLRELAQKKEHEWNNILHLKKVKEEILLRLLRRKQVLSFEKSTEINGSDRTDPFDYLNQGKNLAIDKSDEISGLSIKQPGSMVNPMIQPVMPVTTHFNPMVGLPPPYDKAAHMQSMPKPVYHQPLMMPGPLQGYPRDINGMPTSYGMPMGRQGPTKDVKSIIADYRQRNPEITPRRGRRMKSILNPNMMNQPRPIAPKVDPMNMNNLSNLNMLFNNLDMNQKAMLERLQQIQGGGLPNSIFKDALVQFANMQQQANNMLGRPAETICRSDHHGKDRRRERNHEETHVKPTERMPSTSPRLPPPPPYPEISLLPVTGQETVTQSQQNSLLHGILTKQTAPQTFSPTLAKLLTSPEPQQSTPALPSFGQAKNCGEITITPVQPTPPPAEAQPEKTEEVVQLVRHQVDEESPASETEATSSPAGTGRLVIDEEASEDTPPCQGCKRRVAQFVCAGCANQWYCSRECQVAAWDDHSEMCSG